jgi:pimeloyl-ACP methyl ester carboxylesterase
VPVEPACIVSFAVYARFLPLHIINLQEQMATFVLIHGLKHGGWCWRDVRRRLHSGGHSVFTPTLTGLGERSHLSSPEISLDTHVRDVVNVLYYEDLTDVILVGHSYAGAIIPCVADEMYKRISQLVFVDALLLDHGKSIRDVYGSTERGRRIIARAEKAGNYYIACEKDDLADWGLAGHPLADWAWRRFVAHPLKTLDGPVSFNHPTALKIPRTYIKCSTLIVRDLEFLARRGWRTINLDVGHDAMITAPGELVELFERIAG